MTATNRRLLLIILAQFLGTASWFAGNAVLPTLVNQWQLTGLSLAWVTNSVQLGFIIGALGFAVLSLADRFSPARLFALCAFLSALVNLATAVWVDDLTGLLVLRFFAGMLLAGIYPVGMKIAASWHPKGLGSALGYLVGALALGTALPHLFASVTIESWQTVLFLIAIVNALSGLIILIGVGDGPSMSKPAPLKLQQIKSLYKIPKLRSSAGGYFGHMWELYAVWSIAPIWLAHWIQKHSLDLNLSFLSFCVIAAGAFGSALGGIWSRSVGSAKVAVMMLRVSGLCCLLSPLLFEFGPLWVMLFWFIWGFSVLGDSPQFSALSAQNSPSEAVGTSLTLINSIGFTLTLISVQLLVFAVTIIPVQWAIWLLLPGPILGVLAMRSLVRQQQT